MKKNEIFCVKMISENKIVEMELSDLPPEIIYNLTNFLCIVDRMSFRFTCWGFYNSCIDMDITPFIIKKLRDINPEIDSYEFLSMINNNTVIGGSFLVACLYDSDDYETIDIYESYSTVNSIVPRMEKYKYDVNDFLHSITCEEIDSIRTGPDFDDHLFNNVLICSKITKFLSGYCSRIYHSRKKFSDQFWKNMGFRICKKLFRRFLIRGDIKEFIYFISNLNLCRNYYDGNLFISSWDALITRTSIVKPNLWAANQHVGSSIGRDIIERTIASPKKETYRYILFHVNRIREKCIKYSARGFNIIVVKDFMYKLINNICKHLFEIYKDESLTIEIMNLYDDIFRLVDMSIPFEKLEG